MYYDEINLKISRSKAKYKYIYIFISSANLMDSMVENMIPAKLRLTCWFSALHFYHVRAIEKKKKKINRFELNIANMIVLDG